MVIKRKNNLSKPKGTAIHESQALKPQISLATALICKGICAWMCQLIKWIRKTNYLLYISYCHVAKIRGQPEPWASEWDRPVFSPYIRRMRHISSAQHSSYMGQGHLQQEGSSVQAKKYIRKSIITADQSSSYSTKHARDKPLRHQASQSPLLFFNLCVVVF